MRKSRKLTDFYYCVKFLLALLPLIVLFLSIFRTGQFDLTNLNTLLSDLTSVVWINELNNFIITTFFGGNTSILMTIVVNYFIYLLLLIIVDLVFYSLCFIFRKLEKIMECHL